MSSTLGHDRVRRVLARLQARIDAEDGPAKQRVQARQSELGTRIYGRERAALYGGAPLSIAPEVGKLLYVLAVSRQGGTIVEFGASLGFSTIYLAAAVRDRGTGSLITTEAEPGKARLAGQNLADAGLAELVDVRVGDALETLRDLCAEVDLLFLDGWNDLYLPILDLVEPKLVPGALVVADLSPDDPDLERYCDHMRRPELGYATVVIPLHEGVVLSTRLPQPPA